VQLKEKHKLKNVEHYKYPAIEVKIFAKSHDRFLIIDNATVYHIGASIKDLGKNWVAFAKMELKSFDMIKKLGM